MPSTRAIFSALLKTYGSRKALAAAYWLNRLSRAEQNAVEVEMDQKLLAAHVAPATTGKPDGMITK